MKRHNSNNWLKTFIIVAILFVSCHKPGTDTTNRIVNPPPPSSPPVTLSCTGRPYIAATLVPIGNLSVGRSGLVAATAGNKILFAGGWTPYATNVVDIYDIVSNTWSSAALTDNGKRIDMAVTTAGNKIFFAGGGDGMGDFLSGAVDIYDASTNTWSTSQLSEGRANLAAASAGNKVYFAGGWGYRNGSTLEYSDLVDIYDYTTNQWTTARLSEIRIDITATAAGNKVYFAGGRNGNGISKKIDVFDFSDNTWSASALQEPKAMMASIVSGNKIYWAGGASHFTGSLWTTTNTVEIRDLNTGTSTLDCIIPKMSFNAVKKNEYLVFFTGSIYTEIGSGTEFDIYNTITNRWSTGILNQRLNDAAIISVNNTIYVAGGTDNTGKRYNQVWKLEF